MDLSALQMVIPLILITCQRGVIIIISTLQLGKQLRNSERQDNLSKVGLINGRARIEPSSCGPQSPCLSPLSCCPLRNYQGK